MNYKRYVRVLLNEMCELQSKKIHITDKKRYHASVSQYANGDYELTFSVDQFKGIKRFALPYAVAHEIGHVVDYWRHDILRDTIEQKRKDEIFADLYGVEILRKH